MHILQAIAKSLEELTRGIQTSLTIGVENHSEALSLLKRLSVTKVSRMALKMCGIVPTLKQVEFLCVFVHAFLHVIKKK